MTESQQDDTGEEVSAEDIEAVYGKRDAESPSLTTLVEMRSNFEPWHHPVKQVVRSRQWAALTKKLIQARPQGAPRILKYFTLPGADLLDVSSLVDVCEPLGVKIEYFGFNSGADPSTGQEESPANSHAAPWVMAESALRQGGKITENALILEDRLEDIAEPGSQAAIQLQQRGPFDVVNIDPCDHLAYRPKGRTKTTFDALQALLSHQMGATTPWLLFVTTRVAPDLMGPPGIAFQNAILQNLALPGSDFGKVLCECIKANAARISAELSSSWATHDERFLRLYSIGLGKFLLQFFHGQPNLPANVELASVFAYRVHAEEPDMLALAFQVSPEPRRIFSGQTTGIVSYSMLEPARAVLVAKRAMQLEDIDGLIAVNQYVRNEAIDGTKALLSAARYDLTKWADWLSTHSHRPIAVV